MKKNIKGFALVETLVVTVFVMTIFTLLFTTFYPLAGEYEKLANYDDIDTKYLAHYIRKNIVRDGNASVYSLNSCSGTCHIIPAKGVSNASCATDFNIKNSAEGISLCENYPTFANLTHIYLTQYNLTNFKNIVKADTNNTTYSRSLQEYVANLPTYARTTKASIANYYRVIVEEEHIEDNEKYYSYATIEVKRP